MKELIIHLTNNAEARFIYPDNINKEDIAIVKKKLSELLQLRSHGDNCNYIHSACDDCINEFYQSFYNDNPLFA